jgi:accessory gene regulator B
MVLRMEILLRNIPKLILMIVFAVVLGILPLTLATWLPFAFIRRYASGLHAGSDFSCTIVSLLMFVAAPFALQGFIINEIILLCSFVVMGLGFYKYAPADTVARPIIGAKKRARLKKQTVLVFVLIFAVTLAFQNEMLYGYIALGCLYALIVILPLTYKILKRSVKNYEQYE